MFTILCVHSPHYVPKKLFLLQQKKMKTSFEMEKAHTTLTSYFSSSFPVPSQVLKRKFRGELEPDESEDADDDETNDYDSTFGAIEPSSIPSPNPSQNSHSTQQGSESQGIKLNQRAV